MSALPPPLSNIATPDTVPIGALFVNPQDLYEDLHDSFPTRTDLPTSIVIKPFGIYKTSSTMNKTSKLRSTLVDLLAHTRHSTDTSASELSASEGERHTILSHSTWFEAQCRSEETRQWILKKWQQRHDIYLIVGLLILNNAKLVVESGVSVDRARQARMSLPAGFAMAWTGAGTIGGASLAKRTSTRIDSQFEAPGKSVFGVWYRKIRVGWLRSRDLAIDSSRLAASTTWKPLWEWRGTEKRGEYDRGDSDYDDDDEEDDDEEDYDEDDDDEADDDDDDDDDGDGDGDELDGYGGKKDLVRVELETDSGWEDE